MSETYTKELTCIGCPLGCPVTVTLSDVSGRREIVSVTGNTCPKGDAYARKEVTDPTRIVTTTVRVSGGVLPTVNVKTAPDIPKDAIFDCIAALRGVTVPAPVKIGDRILADVAGTGVAIVAAGNVAASGTAAEDGISCGADESGTAAEGGTSCGTPAQTGASDDRR